VGILLFWPIDPWLNLLWSPRSALLLASSLLSIFLFGRHLPIAQRRQAWRLVGGATLIALGLVYALAVDPKPRMFMSLYAALALVSAAAIMSAFRTNAKPLAIVLALVPVMLGLQFMPKHPKGEASLEQAKPELPNARVRLLR
jgi:hypothetical protein